MEEQVLGGRYRLVRHLARGGMAEVYVAEDELLSRTVAVKVLFPELASDEDFVERFRREARAAASLNHHNIVSVYDFGEDDGSWFIVMEYVAGLTLRDVIRQEGALEPTRAAGIASEVAAALAAAHAEGIVHRDVKPANVLIASDSGTVKVTDFGIARAATARRALTMPGTVLGTATYLSPEQAQGAEVDFRTDVYSLGMVLYEMLAGRPPFTGETPVAVAYQHLSQTAPPPSTYNALVPPALDAIVMKAMAKDPDARQASAAELREQLLDFDRAAGDPDATAAIVSPTVVAPESTTVMAGVGATSVLPPVDPAPPVTPAPARAAPVPPEVYRRRRAGVVLMLALLAVAVIALLVLANGGDKSSGTVAVPSVVGKSSADAVKAVEDAGLKAQVSPTDAAGEADKVLSQDPNPGVVVGRGSTVTLQVPKPAPTTTSPSTTARPATTNTQATTATTAAPSTTQAPATTAPATTVAPTTVAPTTSVFLPTTVVTPTTSR